MVTKIPPRKRTIVLPKDSRLIGRWTDEMIKASLNPNDDNGCLLSQDLLSASKDFYMSKKIETMGNLHTSSYDEEKQTLSRGRHTSNNPYETRRFIVDIGHSKYHESNFNQRNVYKNEDEYHKSFRSMIETHYLWCFDSSELEYIKKALDRENVCHIVIYNRYFRKLSRTKNKVEPYYFVAAAASFILSDTCSVLMYMGVSGDLFYPKLDYATSELESKKIKQESYRQQDFGAYMISMVQKMSCCANGKTTIVAQVKNHSTNGAIYFYLKMYFKIVHGDDNLIYEIKQKFDDIFQDAPGLVYMISRCPLYYIYPMFMDNQTNINCLIDAISYGSKQLLNKNLENEQIGPSSIADELNSAYNKIHNDNKAFFCWMNDNDTDTISLTQETVLTNDGLNDTIIIPNLQFWESRFLPSNNTLFVPSVNNNNNNYNYKVMAILLFKDEHRYPDIRCFFYYILQCLEFMSLEKCILYQTDIHGTLNSIENTIASLQKCIWNTIFLCEELYNTSDLKKYNIPGKQNDPIETSTSIDLYNAIRYIKQKQLTPSYPGSNLEWSIFGSIFNIDLHVFHCYSYEKIGLELTTPGGKRRKWIVQENTKQNPVIFSVFKNNHNKMPIIKCACIIYENLYLLIGTPQLHIQLEHPETIINLKVSKWMHNNFGKLTFPGMTQIESFPFRILTECFDYADYTDSIICLKKRFLMVIMLDPLLVFFEKQISYISSNVMTILDYLSLRPTTYISSGVIDHYIQYLCNRYNNSKSLIIKFSELHSYANNEVYREQFMNKIKEFKHIIIPICISNTHWITLEVRVGTKRSSAIDIYVADSNYLNNENFFLKMENLMNNANYFFFMVTQLCIIEKNFPDTSLITDQTDKQNVLNKFYEKVITLKQASFIIEQDNNHDCGVCCLQRIERIMSSSNRSAEVNKNTPSELFLSTRKFRLIILQRLIPDDLRGVHEDLITLNNTGTEIIKIADIHETGSLEEFVEESFDANNINLYAKSIQHNEHPLPMDNNIETTSKQSINFPIDNEIGIENSELMNPIDSDTEDLKYPSVNIETSVHEKNNILPNKDNRELAIINNHKNTSSVQQRKTPRPEFASLRNPKDDESDSNSSSSDEEESFLPKRGIGEGIIRTDLDSNGDEDPNNDDTSIQDENNNDDDYQDIEQEDNMPANSDDDTVQMNNRDQIINNDPINAPIVNAQNDNEPTSRIQELIDIYDGDVQLATDTPIIDTVPDKIRNKLIERRKRKLPTHQQRNWEVNAYDFSQLDETNAKNAILLVIQRKLDKLRRSLAEIEIRFEATKTNYEESTNISDKEKLLRKTKSIRREWIECKSKILMNEYHEQYTYLFHAKNNIRALRKFTSKINDREVDEYQAYIVTENGEKFVKRVSPDFIKVHLDETYLKYFEKHHHLKGWISFDSDDPINVSNVPEIVSIQDQLDNSYDYNVSENGDIILYVRLNVVMESGTTSESYIYNPDSVEYFYKTHRHKNYKKFDDEVEVQAYFKPVLITKFFNDSIVIARNELLRNKCDFNSRIRDKEDPRYVKEDQGQLGKVQMFYWNTRTYRSKIMEHYQISRIRYNIHNKNWEGIQLEDGASVQIVQLPEKWVKKTFRTSWETFMRISMNGMQKFLDVPVGDIIQVTPTMDISNNPRLKYLQSDKDICVFASLASYLYYYGYINEAQLIYDFKDKHSNIFKNNPSRILQTVVQLIQTDTSFKNFRKIYQIAKIGNNHDVFSEMVEKGEFKIIILRSDDNHMSHAVCINNEFIFDCNVENCLPFSKEGIDCCCGTKYNFVGIKLGYHFQFRRMLKKKKKTRYV